MRIKNEQKFVKLQQAINNQLSELFFQIYAFSETYFNVQNSSLVQPSRDELPTSVNESPSAPSGNGSTDSNNAHPADPLLPNSTNGLSGTMPPKTAIQPEPSRPVLMGYVSVFSHFLN